jgi:hypothetical protein
MRVDIYKSSVDQQATRVDFFQPCSIYFPTSTMHPSRIATSACRSGARVPSAIVPLRTTRSNSRLIIASNAQHDTVRPRKLQVKPAEHIENDGCDRTLLRA